MTSAPASVRQLADQALGPLVAICVSANKFQLFLWYTKNIRYVKVELPVNNQYNWMINNTL
jgi:hypothetical protein